jgi:hypothetical protein
MAEAARRIDIIDARPVFTQADADRLNARFDGVDAATMLQTVLRSSTRSRCFPRRWPMAMRSSSGWGSPI